MPYNPKIVPDFSQDFSSDFERSDPSNSSSLKRGIKCSWLSAAFGIVSELPLLSFARKFERILVGILVKDFYQDNPKQKSLQKIRNSCASHPVGTHLKVRDYASANSLLLGSDFLGIGRCPRHSLLAQTKILRKIYNKARFVLFERFVFKKNKVLWKIS